MSFEIRPKYQDLSTRLAMFRQMAKTVPEQAAKAFLAESSKMALTHELDYPSACEMALMLIGFKPAVFVGTKPSIYGGPPEITGFQRDILLAAGLKLSACHGPHELIYQPKVMGELLGLIGPETEEYMDNFAWAATVSLVSQDANLGVFLGYANNLSEGGDWQAQVSAAYSINPYNLSLNCHASRARNYSYALQIAEHYAKGASILFASNEQKPSPHILIGVNPNSAIVGDVLTYPDKKTFKVFLRRHINIGGDYVTLDPAHDKNNNLIGASCFTRNGEFKLLSLEDLLRHENEAATH